MRPRYIIRLAPGGSGGSDLARSDRAWSPLAQHRARDGTMVMAPDAPGHFPGLG